MILLHALFALLLLFFFVQVLFTYYTGTFIQRLRIFVAQIMWGTYNHGVLFNEVKYMIVQQHAH